VLNQANTKKSKLFQVLLLKTMKVGQRMS